MPYSPVFCRHYDGSGQVADSLPRLHSNDRVLLRILQRVSVYVPSTRGCCLGKDGRRYRPTHSRPAAVHQATLLLAEAERESTPSILHNAPPTAFSCWRLRSR